MLWPATSARLAIALYHRFTCCGRRRSLALSRAILSVYKWIRSELMAPKWILSPLLLLHTRNRSVSMSDWAREHLSNQYNQFLIHSPRFLIDRLNHTLFPVPFIGSSWSQVNEFYMAKKKKRAEREKSDIFSLNLFTCLFNRNAKHSNQLIQHSIMTRFTLLRIERHSSLSLFFGSMRHYLIALCHRYLVKVCTTRWLRQQATIQKYGKFEK